jgi:hypothetical protein
MSKFESTSSKMMVLISATVCFIALESLVGSSNETLIDIGFDYTVGINEYLFHRPLLSQFCAFINTSTVVLTYLYLIYKAINDDFGLVIRGIKIFALRIFLGSLTRLPRPPSYQNENLDWPNMVTSEGQFIYFFSGHTAIVAMVTYIVPAQWRNFMHVVNAIQGVRLIATRGHYTIDIVVGFILGYVAVHNHNRSKQDRIMADAVRAAKK